MKWRVRIATCVDLSDLVFRLIAKRMVEVRARKLSTLQSLVSLVPLA